MHRLIIAITIFALAATAEGSRRVTEENQASYTWEATVGRLNLYCYVTTGTTPKLMFTRAGNLAVGTRVNPRTKGLRRRLKKRKKRRTDLQTLKRAQRSCRARIADDDGSSNPAPRNQMIGANLSWVNSWSAQLIFVDGMKRARNWIPNLKDDWHWDSEVTVPLREDGYPIEIPYTAPDTTQHTVKTLMYDNLHGLYPAGTYTLIFEGKGVVRLRWDAGDRRFNRAGTYSIPITPDDGVLLEILESKRSDPIRNIRFVMPGFADSYESSPFNPKFIQIAKDMPVLRLSQTLQVNGGDYPCDNGVESHDGSCIKRWANRQKPSYYSQHTHRGVAYEYVIDIANEANVDPWFNIQHGATDTHVRNLAILIRDRLKSNLKVYVELSNELWNYSSGFWPQFNWAGERGVALGLDTNEHTARTKYISKRSSEIFAIFKDVFGPDHERVVGVLAGHASNTWYNRELLKHQNNSSINTTGVTADVFAIGAYFGGSIAESIIQAGEEDTVTVDTILDRAHSSLTNPIPDPSDPGHFHESFRAMIRKNKEVTEAFNIPLVAYEGGQHIVEMRGWSNNETLGNKLVAANVHDRMYDIYRDMFDIWFEEGGGLILQYNLIATPSVNWGMWGAMTSMMGSLANIRATNPKYRAMIDWIAENN